MSEQNQAPVEQKDQKEIPLHQRIQGDYMKVCTQIGDLTFKLESLKNIQQELQKQYADAFQKHQTENPPQQ